MLAMVSSSWTLAQQPYMKFYEGWGSHGFLGELGSGNLLTGIIHNDQAPSASGLSLMDPDRKSVV